MCEKGRRDGLVVSGELHDCLTHVGNDGCGRRLLAVSLDGYAIRGKGWESYSSSVVLQQTQVNACHFITTVSR